MARTRVNSKPSHYVISFLYLWEVMPCFLSFQRTTVRGIPMSFELFLVKEGPGRLFLMTRPNYNRKDHEIDRLVQFEIGTIYGLMHPSDSDYRNVSRFAPYFRKNSINFLTFPIFDYKTPEISQASTVAKSAAQRFLEGESIAFQCIASTGRSPMMATATLIMLGDSLEEALQRVLVARNIEQIDSPSQKEWLCPLYTSDAADE